MRGIPTNKKTIQKMQSLRSKGLTVNEIANLTKKSKSIVSKYIKGVAVKKEYQAKLKTKQGGSRERSLQKWKEKQTEAKNLILNISQKEKLLILASLYWGEGSKKELNMINSDHQMLKIFVDSLVSLGVSKDDFRVTLRLFEDISKKESINFWSKKLDLSKECFLNFEISKGKKNGKLPYGMCRIRVKKGGDYFKLIISVIERIKVLLP